MLENLTEQDVEIGIHASGWEDAIRKSSRALLKSGKINQEYIDAMVESVKKYGPYIVLCKRVALAHARPECGAIIPSIHFATLKPGVVFGNPTFDPIELLIVLAASDDRSHLDLLGELAELLMDPDAIGALVGSTTSTEFIQRLRSLL